MVSTITPELKESNKNPKNFHVKKWKPFPENSLEKIGSLISQCGELKKFLEENGNPGPDLRKSCQNCLTIHRGLENNLHEIKKTTISSNHLL